MSKSPFDFDLSVKKAKSKKSRRNRGNSGAFETSSRACEKSGCTNPGKYRAPKTPESTDDYYWYCLDHVREYNSKWNFFETQTAEEIDAQIARDKAWNTRTKPLSGNMEEAKAWARMGIEDPYELLREKATSGRDYAYRRLTGNERKAIELLGVEATTTKKEIRKIYKSLIKDLHPDMNSGSRADEERLNEVIWAWDQIKDSRNFISE